MNTETALPSLPYQPSDTPWPTTAWQTGAMPSSVDQITLQALIESAFSDRDQLGETHAFLIVQGGRIVSEHYGKGFGPEDTHHSWSMAKSITQALVAIAVADGAMSLTAPAKIPEWQGSGDARAQITLEQLLRMSSGLKFNEEYQDAGGSDTIEMLFGSGKANVARYAIDQPLEHAPGTAWSYSSGTTNIVCRLLADALDLDRAGFERFMRDRLFDPIGIRSAIPKFDSAGTFLGSSFCFCTARDFARFGLLYIRGGTWDGKTVVPARSVDEARTPTANVPTEEPMRYGAHWWLDLAGPGSFSANGYDGQYIVLVPEKDLILVRHGASETQKDDVRAWLADVAGCF